MDHRGAHEASVAEAHALAFLARACPGIPNYGHRVRIADKSGQGYFKPTAVNIAVPKPTIPSDRPSTTRPRSRVHSFAPMTPGISVQSFFGAVATTTVPAATASQPATFATLNPVGALAGAHAVMATRVSAASRIVTIVHWRGDRHNSRAGATCLHRTQPNSWPRIGPCVSHWSCSHFARAAHSILLATRVPRGCRWERRCVTFRRASRCR